MPDVIIIATFRYSHTCVYNPQKFTEYTDVRTYTLTWSLTLPDLEVIDIDLKHFTCLHICVCFWNTYVLFDLFVVVFFLVSCSFFFLIILRLTCHFIPFAFCGYVGHCPIYPWYDSFHIFDHIYLYHKKAILLVLGKQTTKQTNANVTEEEKKTATTSKTSGSQNLGNPTKGSQSQTT